MGYGRKNNRTILLVQFPVRWKMVRKIVRNFSFPIFYFPRSVHRHLVLLL